MSAFRRRKNIAPARAPENPGSANEGRSVPGGARLRPREDRAGSRCSTRHVASLDSSRHPSSFGTLLATTSQQIVHGQNGARPRRLHGIGDRRRPAPARCRPRRSRAFLPSRGTFTFPSPYRTTGVRLSNASDCGGADCVLPVGYSYWSNINNHAGSDTMLIFLGLESPEGRRRADAFQLQQAHRPDGEPGAALPAPTAR